MSTEPNNVAEINSQIADSIEPPQQSLYQLSEKRQQIQEEIVILRQQKIDLEKEKSLLKNDKKHIEKLAREKYRMAKPNERIFKVIEKDR